MNITDRMRKIKSIFREIEIVKAELDNEIRMINADETRSGNYKAAKRNEAKEKAQKLLEDIFVNSEPHISELRKEAKNAITFDYNNQKLLSAMELIKATGKFLPGQAAEQIINDFRNKPYELDFLSSIFEKNGLINAAMEAKEIANTKKLNVAFPDRLDDLLYYSTTGDPSHNVDFSGIESEMDDFTAVIETANTENTPS